AMLPAVGTGLVWVPVSIYMLATGHIWQGIVMALMGAFVIGTIDNVLRPILVGRETQMPDALVLLVTLGGLSAFGFNGLIIGPVIASLFLAAWEMVRQEQEEGIPVSAQIE
ncbi:MAG: AI-2E family transporter, partial [Sphingomonas bacterium]